MEQLKILKDDDLPRLPCRNVDFETDKGVDQLSKNMFYTMKMSGGIGLAAPQVGSNLRIITIDTTSSGGQNMLIMINPTIITQEGQCEYQEGCLSFTGKSVLTQRSEKISVEFYDWYGNKKIRSFSGIDAICIQHEVDHLNGITFFERKKQ